MATCPNKAILLKYVLQDCTPEEIIFVESWIKNDADIKKQIDQLKLLYQTDKETNQAAFQEPTSTKSETDSKTFGWKVQQFRFLKEISICKNLRI